MGSADTQIVIEPRRGWVPLNLRELWQHRELLYFLTWRDVKVRYKQTVLGATWAVLQPFITMIVLTIIFKKLLGLDRRLMGTAAANTPYAVFLFAGLLPWQFFAKAVQRGSASVVADSPLVGKVYFPRLVLPMASMGSALMDFALSFVILAGLMAWYRIAPGVRLVAVVPLSLVTCTAALGIGAFMGALNVAYRDLRYIVPFLLHLWFYATPIFWALGKVPEPFRVVAGLNPMCGVVEAYRWAVLPDWPLDVPALAASACVSVLMLIVGLNFFRRIEGSFADVI